MGKEIKKETDFFGREKLVIYEDGKKVGETRQETDIFGREKQVTYDTNGKKVSETREETGALGGKKLVTYGTDGKKISETRYEKDILGPKEVIYQNQEKIGELREEKAIFGLEKEVLLEKHGHNVDLTTRRVRTETAENKLIQETETACYQDSTYEEISSLSHSVDRAGRNTPNEKAFKNFKNLFLTALILLLIGAGILSYDLSQVILVLGAVACIISIFIFYVAAEGTGGIVAGLLVGLIAGVIIKAISRVLVSENYFFGVAILGSILFVTFVGKYLTGWLYNLGGKRRETIIIAIWVLTTLVVILAVDRMIAINKNENRERNQINLGLSQNRQIVTATVSVSAANIRREPDLTSKIITTVQRGRKVFVIKENDNGDWVLIAWPENPTQPVGWVFKNLIKFTDGRDNLK
jgi:hypothetical protein